MVAYTETRSSRAIVIDRSRTARQVYGDCNQKYAGSPNRSGVEGYDTGGNEGVYVPPPKPKEKEKTTGEYVPTEQEKAELLPHFYQLNPMEQHKDLLVTKNVIKRKSDVDKWKENPKYYDVRGIDTQPEELVSERLRVVHKHVGNIPIVPEGGMYHIKDRNALAGYSSHPLNYKDLGRIIFRPKKIQKSTRFFAYNRVIAHELGHAYDRNVINRGTARFGVNIGYDVWNQIPGSIEKKNLGFGNTNNVMAELGRKSYKEVWGPVEIVTRERIFPYNPKTTRKNHHEYRQKSEELFANWFSGFINQKNVVKKRSARFYNIFKKQNKPLFRDLRKSDYNVTTRYRGGNKLSNWGLF